MSRVVVFRPLESLTCMELKLVYRALRKLSDWTLEHYYSEVHVQGFENVPKDGPLILAASHHNEIIDIATLAVTIPYRRRIGFWAKSTLFKNPVSRAILVSSGSIPVERVPRRSLDQQDANVNEGGRAVVQEALYHSTSQALGRGEVIGVFPEGASATDPCLAELRDGVAWSAVEYAKWKKRQRQELLHVNGNGNRVKEDQSAHRNLILIPVGIIYTDKSQYQSRISVRYGKPIRVDGYPEEVQSSISVNPNDPGYRALAKKITAQLDQQLLTLTINASSWDDVYCGRMAKDILWGGARNIPLQNFQSLSQTLSDIFALTLPTQKSTDLQSLVRKSLIRYYSLLYYTGVDHASLTSLWPLQTSARSPSLRSAFVTVFVQTVITFFHLRALLFLPVFIIHIPAYVLGWLGGKMLSSPAEEETIAQYRVVFGLLGAGISYACVCRILWRFSTRWVMQSPAGANFLKDVESSTSGGGLFFQISRVVILIGVFYSTSLLLSQWHRTLLRDNYLRLKKFVVSVQILLGLLSPETSDVSALQLSLLSRPPVPFCSQLIMRRCWVAVTPPDNNAMPGGGVSAVGFRRLVRPLFAARQDAATLLAEYLEALVADGGTGGQMVTDLRVKGMKFCRIPVTGRTGRAAE